MKINNYVFPKSSFLSIDKDIDIITSRILKNNRLQKLLHYNVPDALRKGELTDDERLELFDKNIKIVPKLYIDGSVLNYIILSFDNFTPNATNPEFRDNIISFDIICHFDQWKLEGFELRPYRIAAEIDTMLNNTHLTGIGKLQFMGCNQLLLNEEYAGVSLMYAAIHGEEDKVGMLDPMKDAQYIEEFDEMYNS